MDTRKLFIVSVELETLVLAESQDEAREIADDQNALKEEMSNLYRDDFTAHHARHLPGDWNDGCLVYHAGDGDITVAEAMVIDPRIAEQNAMLKAKLSGSAVSE